MWVIDNNREILFAALFSPLFLDIVFSNGLGVRNDWVIRALCQETQLQSHTAESWCRFIQKQQHLNVRCDRSHCSQSCSWDHLLFVLSKFNPISTQLFQKCLSFGLFWYFLPFWLAKNAINLLFSQSELVIMPSITAFALCCRAISYEQWIFWPIRIQQIFWSCN